jgi:SAM-dependent methyltransferase
MSKHHSGTHPGVEATTADSGDPGPTDLLHTHPGLYAAYLPEAPGITAFVKTAIDHFNPRASEVLDIGCGLGREIAALDAQGYRCVGLDASPAMAGAARQRYPHLNIELGDQRLLARTRVFDVVLSLGSALLHNKNLVDLRRTISGVASVLQPDGIVVVEARNGGYWLTGSGHRALATEHSDEAVVAPGKVLKASLRYRVDLRRQLLLRDYTWRLPDGTRVSETLEQLLLTPGHLLDEFQAAGLTPVSSFSEPAATDRFEVDGWPPDDELTGRRIHIVAVRSREAVQP